MKWPPLRLALVVGLLGALLNVAAAPFHGAAYFATEDGSTELMPHQEAWGAWVREHVPVAFSGGADAAYLFWGKLSAASFVLTAFALAGLHGAQEARLARGARIVGRTLVATWGVVALIAVFLYYVAVLDPVFVAMLPFLLASLVLTGVYGIQTVRRGAYPRAVGWALFSAALAFVPLVIFAGHIPFGLLGFDVLWLVAASTLLWATPAHEMAEAPA